MRETCWNELGVVLVCICIHCGYAYMCCVWKGRWLGDRGRMMRQQESVRKGKSWGKRKRRERREKVVWEKRVSFLLLCDCVFHSTPSHLSIHLAITLLLIHSQDCVCFCQSANWQCANHTISGEERTIAIWPQANVCQIMIEREMKRVGFDWMMWKWLFHHHLLMSVHPPILCPWGTVIDTV